MRGLRSRVLWDLRATMPFLPATSESGYYGRTCPVTGKFAYPQRAENRKEGTPQEMSSRADVSSRATARDLLSGSRGRPRGPQARSLAAARDDNRVQRPLPSLLSPLFWLVAATPVCKRRSKSE